MFATKEIIACLNVNKSEDQHITRSVNSTQDQSIPTHENYKNKVTPK